MQETVTALHTHVLVVILFLILFTAKAILLFLNKHKQLEKAKRYTKALDAVFGILILVSGGYLLYLYNGMPGWLITKVILVLLAIPIGIVGLRRHSKLLTILALLIFLYVYGVAETKSLTMQQPGPVRNTTTAPVPGETPETGAPVISDAGAPEEIISSMNEAQLTNAKAIYTQVCATCHGTDGTKGLGGAARLTISNLSLKERINVIENGRGLMPGFNEQLTEQEAEALAAYTMTLKNK
ncbi:SirB2 family protein [Pontibacter locisalis]|uniref:SirB2 family protein n=1 Tax=Pontibacter locisalis TaxID=1719035 RepID=A0ABW5IIJ7_9BACT